jgi:methylglutaconyl-CoA hydratase
MIRGFFKFYKKFNSTINPTDSVIISKLTGKHNNIMGLYLNNPKTKNALSRNLVNQMSSLVENINLNPQIRVVYLMSKEPGYFCTGADLKERQTMNESEVERFVTKLRSLFHEFSEMKIPSICAIDGFALGGGLELAMSADIRIATKSSTVGLSECSLGIIPGAGGTQKLPRLIGASKAKEMIFTAERVNGEKALAIGLVNHIVESYNDLEPKAIEIAEKIVKNAPLAVMLSKKAINEGIGHDIKLGLEIEKLCYAQIIKTEDRLEGLKAFIEKRPPQYKGK